MSVNTEVDVRDKIMEHLEKDDRNLSWLHRRLKEINVDISYPHLYYILARKERLLTEANRSYINQILQTNY